MICDLVHPGHLVYMEGTAAVAVAAGQTGGSLAAQVGVVVPGQGVTGLGQIVFAFRQHKRACCISTRPL